LPAPAGFLAVVGDDDAGRSGGRLIAARVERRPIASVVLVWPGEPGASVQDLDPHAPPAIPPRAAARLGLDAPRYQLRVERVSGGFGSSRDTAR
jgi:hypothetical protein